MVDATCPPNPHQLSLPRYLLVNTMANIENWSGYAIAGLGALSVVCIAAAAQVWNYPAPRAVLSIMAWKAGNLAFLWACVAIAIRSGRHCLGCYTAPVLPRGSAPFYVITIAMTCFILWWWGYPLLVALERFINCSAGVYRICNVDLQAAEKIPDFTSKLEAFLAPIPK